MFDENKSLWSNDWFKNSYLSYFLFTQTSRLHYVLSKAKLHFSSFNNIVDFGCGPGTAQKVFEHVFQEEVISNQWINIDSSTEALNLAKVWNDRTSYKTKFIKSDKIPKAISENDLFIAAYSLCELKDMNPVEIKNLTTYKNIIILEPGQKKESKKLIQLRNELVENSDFNVLAPCTHQMTCPMTSEKRHWCHDHVQKPKFLNKLDLPFSQDQLNLSYLILSKESKEKCQNYGRVVGDLRIEKGKSKIAICHNGALKYLSSLKKTKLSLDLIRGDLIEWVDSFEKKGNEFRVSRPLQKVIEDHSICDSSAPIS